MTVIGVRSSWPASSMNCRCVRERGSSRPSISLNVAASSEISSCPPTGIRWVRSDSEIERAVRRDGGDGSQDPVREAACEQGSDHEHDDTDDRRGQRRRLRVGPERLGVDGHDEHAGGYAVDPERHADVVDVAGLRLDPPLLGDRGRRPAAGEGGRVEGSGQAAVPAVRLAADEGGEELVIARDVPLQEDREDLVDVGPERPARLGIDAGGQPVDLLDLLLELCADADVDPLQEDLPDEEHGADRGQREDEHEPAEELDPEARQRFRIRSRICSRNPGHSRGRSAPDARVVGTVERRSSGRSECMLLHWSPRAPATPGRGWARRVAAG